MVDQNELSEEFDGYPKEETIEKLRAWALSWQAPKGENEKWTSSNIQNDISSLLLKLSRSKKLIDVFPEFFTRVRTYRFQPSDPRIVLSVDDKLQVTVVGRDWLQTLMGEFYNLLFENRYSNESIGITTQNSLTDRLMEYLPRLERDEIKPFCFSDEHDYCWKKLDWKLMPQEALCFYHVWNQELGATHTPLTVSWREFMLLFEEWSPAWHSVLLRCGNAEAFAAWLGSLMKRDCKNTQYVLMQGQGNDSKGSVINSLLEIFGEKITHSENVPKPESGQARFYSGSLEGKRLVASPETNPKHLFSVWFNSLTGGDRLAVERKGQQTRNAVNHARFICGCNPLPDHDFDEATLRRLILVPISSVRPEDRVADFYKKLVDEANFFFSIAYRVFLNMPKEISITQDRKVYEENFDMVNEEEIHIIHDHFYFYPNADKEFELWDGEKYKYPHMMRSAEFALYCSERLPKINKRRIIEILKRENVGQDKLVKGKDVKPYKVRLGIAPKYTDIFAPPHVSNPFPPVSATPKTLNLVP